MTPQGTLESKQSPQNPKINKESLAVVSAQPPEHPLFHRRQLIDSKMLGAFEQHVPPPSPSPPLAHAIDPQ